MLVSCMVAEPRGRDSSLSLGSTESQYGLRHISGVPVWNGDILTLRDYETAALWFRAGLKPGEQERAVARLWANLQGPSQYSYSCRTLREAINTPPGLRCSLFGNQHLFSHNITESRLILPVIVHLRKVNGLTLHYRSFSFLHHLVVWCSVVSVQGQHAV